MQDKVTLTLTKAEFKVLLHHFRKDVEDYGVNGTFGDGDDFTYWDTKKDKMVIGTKELRIAERVVEKLEKEL